MNTLPALSQAFCTAMLQTQMQTQPNPSLRKQPTQRDSEMETAITQGDRASDKARDQGPWEPRGQGRRGPMGFLGEVHPHGHLDEKEESGCWGRRGAGQSFQKKRQRV